MNLNKYCKSTSLWIHELCLCCWSVQFTVACVVGVSNLPWHMLLECPIYRDMCNWSVQFTVVWVVGVSNLPWFGIFEFPIYRGVGFKECPIYRDTCFWCIQFTVVWVVGGPNLPWLGLLECPIDSRTFVRHGHLSDN